MALPIPEKDAIEKLRERTAGTPYRFIGFVGEWHGVSTKLKMNCDLHGEWLSTTYNKFINDGRTCPACSSTKRLTQSEVVSNVKGILKSEKSLTSLVKLEQWRGCRTYLHLKCTLHGEWKTTNYNKFMMGRRCPGCAKKGFDSTIPGTLYILKRFDENAIKIGISNNFEDRLTVLRRETPFGFNVVGTLNAEGAFVQLLEKTLHSIHSMMNSANYSGFDGCTEWFILDDVVKFSLNVLGIKWDDGDYSCHAQRDLKRVGTLYGLSHA